MKLKQALLTVMNRDMLNKVNVDAIFSDRPATFSYDCADSMAEYPGRQCFSGPASRDCQSEMDFARIRILF